jgi:hypothetical protein
MNAALRDYYLLWRMALSTRARHAHTFVLGLSALATLLVGFLVHLKNGDALLTIGMGLRVALGCLALGAVMYFLPGAVKLNTPVNARLVPRMRRRLVQLTVGIWIVATLLATVLAIDTRLSLPGVFLATGEFIAIYGLAVSGHPAGTVLQCAIVPFIMMRNSVFGDLVKLATRMPYFAPATCLLLAFGAWVLATMFMNGGERHYAMRKREKVKSERRSPAGQFRERKANPFTARVYSAILRRDCARRDGGTLLGHLLGAREHWTNQVLVLGGAALLAGAVIFAARNYGNGRLTEFVSYVGGAFATGCLLLPLFEFERRNVRLMDTRGEQALLRLAPVMPASPSAFNRGVARMLLGRAVFGWCVLVAVVLWLTAAAGPSGPGFFRQACLCCLLLPLLGTNLRDHARRSSLLGLGPVLVLLVTAGISFAVGAVASQIVGIPVTAGAALASIVIALVVVPWRWQRSVEAPVAFPAGRLA